MVIKCHAASKQKTEELAQAAATAVYSTNLPAIIIGDLNWHPSEIPSTQLLCQYGWTTAECLFEKINGYPQPPTCRGATKHDVILLCPKLSHWVVDVKLLDGASFHDHTPVAATMSIPLQQVHSPIVLKRPTAWMAYNLDQQLLQNKLQLIMDSMSENKRASQSFSAWSKMCESAVDQTLQDMHADDPVRNPYHQLPQDARGRCSAKPFQRKKPPVIIKQACQGQYTPSVETGSFHLRLVTKRLRRVQSLLARLQKHDSQRQDLQREWKKICQAKGFPPNFRTWTQTLLDLAWWPYDLPTVNLLDDLQQLLRYHCKAIEASVSNYQKQSNRFAKWYDHRFGYDREARKRTKDINQD